MPVTAVRDEGALRMWVCRLPVHIDRQNAPFFIKICGGFATSHWADRVVGPYGEISMHSYPCRGGRLCPPAEYIGFTEIFGEIATSQRADVGIGPYRTPANPYCLTTFKRKADLQQPFKRNDLQIWCTVTGGAYHSARKVSMCVRND